MPDTSLNTTCPHRRQMGNILNFVDKKPLQRCEALSFRVAAYLFRVDSGWKCIARTDTEQHISRAQRRERACTLSLFFSFSNCLSIGMSPPSFVFENCSWDADEHITTRHIFLHDPAATPTHLPTSTPPDAKNTECQDPSHQGRKPTCECSLALLTSSSD
jgi:hypothetical protein